ncbi:carboxymuconolactone decarboxylase family protein [Mucilaginibacter sp. Bleaf8]|uniref:carboxymuconolactone decarboxylase family protein n=1 Tax=Mucilaginibacter sp. Bleaf8 TaxID=2834430 RepID=UPI001BD01F18|nr:carboxymuconolactone decarboxylase family protein [Mucilaginibacter sp. Bleaf8]MBS7566346.1 carboxymuconolactone decarboxylase family protein [Mucilaginibacter sp. Bleaf8]
METRININEVQPEAYKAMLALEEYIQKSGLDKKLYELIKIRASQINGCAFCLDMHTRDARRLGETDQRMHLLNAWRETTLFTIEERAALALTEEVTKIQGGVSSQTYQEAFHLFGETKTAQIIMAAITINAWNRIAISTQLQPQ